MTKNKNLDIFFIVKKIKKRKQFKGATYKVVIKSNKGFVTKKVKKHYAKACLQQNYIKVTKGLYVNAEKLNFDSQESELLKEARKNGERVLNLLHDLPKKLCDSVISKLEDTPSQKKKKPKLVLMPQKTSNTHDELHDVHDVMHPK